MSKSKTIPQHIIDHIQERAGNLEFGSITLEFNKTAKKFDVITTQRVRFHKENEKG